MPDDPAPPLRHEPDAPLVSVIMANHNGAAFIDAAICSVLRQTLSRIEIVVADDASTDDSVARVARHAAEDPRIVLIRRPVQAGAAAARNSALDRARGTFVAVMDSDDLMHPDRLRRLVDLAWLHDADIVADDVLAFSDKMSEVPRALLQHRAEGWVEAAAYVEANAMDGGPALGYLKPLFRRQAIAAHGIRYDTSLPIAEDYAFVLALLLRGARFWVSRDLTYFYRRHPASLSHRLSVLALERMRDADAALVVPAALAPKLAAALARRRRHLDAALAFERLVGALKHRRWRAALAVCRSRPATIPRLFGVLATRLRRLAEAGLRRPSSAGRPGLCLIARQRLVGKVNGSSNYLLTLCDTLQSRGFDMHLICPSPAMFGRWPVLWLRPDMAVFASIRIRGAWRMGRLVIARDPRRAFQAGLAVTARLLARTGISITAVPAPFAVAVPWERDDFLFVARNTRSRADAILADYAFLTEAIPYALRPDAPSAVVMHDLFSADPARPDTQPSPLVEIAAEAEMALLSNADAILAIHPAEAAAIRRHLPLHRVLLTPMAVTAAAAPQPGDDTSCLFVGSAAAPNVEGLGWFLAEVWPDLRARLPTVTLTVAGGVAARVSVRPDGVRFLGQVGDLAPLYRQAGVVISPLRRGSGLKIKLVEALGHGKACVVTSVTLQGVADLVGTAVLRADTKDAFAEGVAALLSDAPRRATLAAAALDVARQHFSEAACTAPVADFFLAGLAHLAAAPTPERLAA